jgi:putative Holliday junction resolvase
LTVLLGIDLGDRRIGVATADTDTGAVKPLLTLRRDTPAADATALRRISRERRADELIVGLPLHRDGRESEQSRRTRAWADAVGPLVGLPVTLRDERLTSEAAVARMGRAPRGRSGGAPSPRARSAWRARIDREAAADILQRELDARTTSEVTT